MAKAKVVMNKTVYLIFTMLDISKIGMLSIGILKNIIRKLNYVTCIFTFSSYTLQLSKDKLKKNLKR